MAEGQRLRWWQEQEEHNQTFQSASHRAVLAAPLLTPETAATTATTATEPLILLDEYADTWKDLEAEAVRRAEQVKLEEAESVSFYLDKSAALVRHRREILPLWWLAGILITVCVIIPLVLHFLEPNQHHSFPNIGTFAGFGVIFSLHIRRRHWLQNHEKPSVRLRPQGLSIHTSLYSDIFLPWNNITEIKPKGSGKRRCLEIRALKRRRYVISEQDLPISAEALAARIAVYETGRFKA